jgi:hypothetical protein
MTANRPDVEAVDCSTAPSSTERVTDIVVD